MPDIERRVLTSWGAVSAVALGTLLAAAAHLGEAATAFVVALASLVATYGWPRLLDLPSPRGVQAVLCFATVVSVGATLVGDGPDLRWLPVGLAATLVGTFLHQLLRRDGRARLVGTLGGTLLAAGVIAAGACTVAAVGRPDGGLLVLSVALAVAISTLVDRCMVGRRRAEWALPLGAAPASALAAVVAQLTGGPVLAVVLAAVAACVVSHAMRRLLTVVATASSARAQVAIGAAAVLAAGPVPYVGAWLVAWFASR